MQYANTWAKFAPTIPFELPPGFTPRPAEDDDDYEDSVGICVPDVWDFGTGRPMVFDVHYREITFTPDGDPVSSSVVWRYHLHLSLNSASPLLTKGKVEVVDKFAFAPSPIQYTIFDILDHCPCRFMFRDTLLPPSGSGGTSTTSSKRPHASLAEYTIAERGSNMRNDEIGEEVGEALMTTILLHPGTPHKWWYCTFSGRVVLAATSQTNEDANTEDGVYSNLVLYDFLN